MQTLQCLFYRSLQAWRESLEALNKRKTYSKKKKKLKKKTRTNWSSLRISREPSQAVLIPRLVSELEHEVMSSCLVRQGREVEEGIGRLQAYLRYSEATIKGTYKELSMQQQGYCLHTKMVHKGHN